MDAGTLKFDTNTFKKWGESACLCPNSAYPDRCGLPGICSADQHGNMSVLIAIYFQITLRDKYESGI